MKYLNTFNLFESHFNLFRDSDEVINTCKELLSELDFLDINYRVSTSELRKEYYILIFLSKPGYESFKFDEDISDVISSVKNYLLDWGFEIMISNSTSTNQQNGGTTWTQKTASNLFSTHYDLKFKIAY
jgi:hypothetical protein